MSRPRRSTRLFAEMVEDPRRALVDRRFQTPALCRRWLDHVDDEVHSGAAKAVPLAHLGLRLALRVSHRRQERGLRDPCLLALAWSVLGSTYRAAGQLARASRAQARAARRAERCPDPNVRAEVLLRRAILGLYLAQRADGTLDPLALAAPAELAERAVTTARGPLAEARARNARGIIRYHQGDLTGSARDGKEAIELLDASTRPFDHFSALSIVVAAIARGTKVERQEGAVYLERLRNALPPRSPELRARFLWAEALLFFPDRQRKGRTRRLLDQARRKFLKLGMQAEATAVTAELARLDPAGAVPQLCVDLLVILDPGPLCDLVAELRRVRFAERLPLAERLRSSVSGGVLLPIAA